MHLRLRRAYVRGHWGHRILVEVVTVNWDGKLGQGGSDRCTSVCATAEQHIQFRFYAVSHVQCFSALLGRALGQSYEEGPQMGLQAAEIVCFVLSPARRVCSLCREVAFPCSVRFASCGWAFSPAAVPGSFGCPAF